MSANSTGKGTMEDKKAVFSRDVSSSMDAQITQTCGFLSPNARTNQLANENIY